MTAIDASQSPRHLLAAIHQWARLTGWRRGRWGWVSPNGAIVIEVQDRTDAVTVYRNVDPDRSTWAELRPRHIDADSVMQAVDLLVAYGYLPPMWSSAYGAAVDQHREEVETLEARIAGLETALGRENENRLVWKPLKAVIPADQLGDWMWMDTVQHGDRTIQQYKHRDTRGYLNLDQDGAAWRFRYVGGGCGPFCEDDHQHREDSPPVAESMPVK